MTINNYQSPEMLICIIPQDALLAESGGLTTSEIYEEQVTEW